MIENLFTSNPTLEALNAVTVNSNEINLQELGRMRELRELRLRSTGRFLQRDILLFVILNGIILDCITLQSSLEPFRELINLRHLSLTSVVDLGKMDVSVFGELIDLETLELGECSELSETFAISTLSKLLNLERLRLEKCQHNCATSELLSTIANLPKLTQLELINVDVSTEFEEQISKCTNLRKLLLIPT